MGINRFEIWSKTIGAAMLFFAVALPATGGRADTCSDWRKDHRQAKAEVVHGHVTGQHQTSLDEAVYDVLQFEVLLSACRVPAAERRAEHIGWRLVGRLPSEFVQVVVGALLDEAGVVSGLENLLDGVDISRTR